MILDCFDGALIYESLNPLFARAFAYLLETDLKALPVGKHTIDGDRLFAIAARDDGRGRSGAKLEAHREYLDIQFVIEGEETMGWRPLADCSHVEMPYDAKRDIAFFTDRPTSWFTVPTGSFAILWPSDAHAPLAGTEPVRKVVLKVAVQP